MNSGAEFSENRWYRYALWRIWNENKPPVMFIGLNPSTANERKDDATIRRVIRFAFDFGAGGLYMMNLFAFVTPHPYELAEAHDPLGDNDDWLERISGKCDRVIFAWGAFGDPKGRNVIRERAEAVKARFPGAYCLTKTKSGHPAHPLYLPKDTKPTPFFT